MTKAFGRDINNFWNNHFPANCFVEDDKDWIEDYIKDDQLCLPEGKKFELKDFGYLLNEDTGSEKSFESFFKGWLKSQNAVTIVVEVSKTKHEEAVAHLKELGFKVIK